MSHEILETDHMVSGENVTPWHALGSVVEGTMSLDEALTLARLDWTVSKQPIFVQSIDGLLTPVPDRWATVRDDIGLPLGVVGGKYEPLQNNEGFEMLGVLMDGGDVEVVTAGSLRNSRVVWVLAKLDRDVMVGGDPHVAYILFVTSHDGTASVRVMLTPVRVVCANTMRMAIDGTQNQWAVRHTVNVKGRIAEARESLGLSWAYYDAFEAEVEALLAADVNEATFRKLIDSVFPIDADKPDGRQATNMGANRAAVASIYNDSPLIGEYKGTAWGAFQAFSTWDLWSRTPRKGVSVSEAQAKRVIGGNTEAFAASVRSKLGKLVGV